VVCSCEHGNEHLGLIKGREFLDTQLSVLSAFQGLCCLELVTNQIYVHEKVMKKLNLRNACYISIKNIFFSYLV
jgi:hypothetical protein